MNYKADIGRLRCDPVLDTEEGLLSEPVVTHTVCVPRHTTEPAPLASAERAAHVHAPTFRGRQYNHLSV